MYTDAGIKLWLSGRRGSTAQPDGYARDLKLAFSSLLKKVFEVSRWATLIQDPSARRTKDSQPSGFGFEYCASHVRFRVFQQTARAQQTGKLETRALFAASQGGTVAAAVGNTCAPLFVRLDLKAPSGPAAGLEWA